jgi:hypothetical protein
MASQPDTPADDAFDFQLAVAKAAMTKSIESASASRFDPVSGLGMG